MVPVLLVENVVNMQTYRNEMLIQFYIASNT